MRCSIVKAQNGGRVGALPEKGGPVESQIGWVRSPGNFPGRVGQSVTFEQLRGVMAVSFRGYRLTKRG